MTYLKKTYKVNIYLYICVYAYIGTQSKCTKQWKQSSAIKQLLETLFLTITICNGFTRQYMYEHIVCSVTSKPSQSSSRHVSSFKDSSNVQKMRCFL